MCGIAGWFAQPGVNWRPTRQMIATMLDDIELRGVDATGYGTLRDNPQPGENKMFIYKGPVRAKEFNEFFLEEKNIPIGRVGLLHTRGASVGEPSVNANNHPIPYKYDNRMVMVVHNGGVGNLDAAYKKMAIEPPAEV